MAYEQGNIPDLRSENRSHRFSWKALVFTPVAIALFAVPVLAMLGWLGAP